MYQLTARMEQSLERYLRQYHELFDADGCKAWQLEELIVKAIKSDTHAQHHPLWKEAGHDDEADVTVRTNGTSHALQIKSGKFKNDTLELSGHRLGRYKGDIEKITNYLNSAHADILAVPHDKWEDNDGRHHKYTHHIRKSECDEYIFFYDPSTYPKSAYHFSG